MIFSEHRAIFFHVGRTGGTSVERMLSGEKLDPYTPNFERMFGLYEGVYLQHATCEVILGLVGREIFDAYYKFTLVRNPFSRLVSVYYYSFDQLLKRWGSFKGYVHALPGIVEQPQIPKGVHATPQHRYTHIGGERVVDAILRFEDLPGCVDAVRTRLNVTAPLPFTNKTRQKSVAQTPTPQHYDAEMVDIVRRVYADDFALYGYPDTP